MRKKWSFIAFNSSRHNVKPQIKSGDVTNQDIQSLAMLVNFNSILRILPGYFTKFVPKFHFCVETIVVQNKRI